MQENNKRIAKNTLMLYFRMMLIMGVSLYTSRVVLEVLGVEDFGIYNVVGGIVVMFGFLNSAMSSATQRFLSFEMGRKDYAQLKKVFSLSVTIHALIAVVIFILAETIGLWFLNTQLTIPADRMEAANWVYQFSIFAFMVNVMAVPYNAAIISHERMNVYAYVSIIEVILKLAIVILLQYLGFDKLRLYAILIFIVSFIIRMIFQLYCKRKFEECTYHFVWDKTLFYKLLSHAGWNLFGSGSVIVSSQGINMLLNIFFGPTVNAARGIAFQINGALTAFVTNFQTAINPQLIKSFANQEIYRMHQLIFRGSKYSFYLLLILVVPIFFQIDFILSIWLKFVPDNTAIFTKLVLTDALICSLSGPLWISGQAAGNIRNYQIIVGTIILLNLPISYAFLSIYSSPIIPFISTVIISTLAIIARVVMLRRMIQLKFSDYFIQVLSKVLLVSIISFITCWGITLLPIYTNITLLSTLIKTLFSIATIFTIIVTIGIKKNERVTLINKTKAILTRINHKK